MTDKSKTAEEAATRGADAIKKALDSRIARQIETIVSFVEDADDEDGRGDGMCLELEIVSKRTLENSEAFEAFQNELRKRGITTRLYTKTSGQGYAEVETDCIFILW